MLASSDVKTPVTKMRLKERSQGVVKPRPGNSTTNASKHHARMSSIAAQVIAIEPSRVRCNRAIGEMRASTGNAVTDIEIPMKSANTANWNVTREKVG